MSSAAEKKQPKSKSESLPKVVQQSPSVESIEKMFQLLNELTKSNVDEDVESFCNHISLKLQKVPMGEQREMLFADINRLILETLYLRCVTAPHPCTAQNEQGNFSTPSHPPPPMEPHAHLYNLGVPAAQPNAASVHSDQGVHSNWYGNGHGEYELIILFQDL